MVIFLYTGQESDRYIFFPFSNAPMSQKIHFLMVDVDIVEEAANLIAYPNSRNSNDISNDLK